MIGGATTSRAHTAVKIEHNYHGPSVYVSDASRAVGVANKLLSQDKKEAFVKGIQAEYQQVRERHKGRKSKSTLLTLTEARANKFEPNNSQSYRPSFLGTKVIDNIPLETLSSFIDWSPFFQTWELAGSYPAILEDSVVGEHAKALFQDASVMLASMVTEKWLSAKAVIGFYPANSQGDDIVIYEDEQRSSIRETLCHLRQQNSKVPGKANYCLADFLKPVEAESQDYIGAFAVTAGIGIEAKLAEFERQHDDYSAIMLKALADRLAEAFAEYLHQQVRVNYWGYSSQETLDNQALIKESYEGIRPAPGYPACPDHTEKGKLFSLLSATENTGIELTESYAMYPTAAVSGWYLAHADARFFNVGKITTDQLTDYAQRKGWSMEEARRWLAPNLLD